jgi:hypothetical protein
MAFTISYTGTRTVPINDRIHSITNASGDDFIIRVDEKTCCNNKDVFCVYRGEMHE